MTPEREPNRIWALIQGVGVALVLALFLWASREILSPLFLFVVLVVALHPFRGRPGHSLLVALAAAGADEGCLHELLGLTEIEEAARLGGVAHLDDAAL